MTNRTTLKPTGRKNEGAPTSNVTEADPAMQGEGNYSAARRHRKSVERFVDSGEVDQAARAAAPQTEEEANELRKAEEAGQAHARQ